MAQICGVLDESISPYLKAWVKQGERMVCGIIGPGTSRTLSSRWDSPLEQSNVGSNISEVAGGLGQATTDITTTTQLSSTQVWRGNMPIKHTLNLIFMAQTDAFTEVMQPLQWLEEFASPSLNELMPGGRIPGSVSINIGRRLIVVNCVIENVPIPLDKERTSDGSLIRAEVNLDIQSKVMLSKDNGSGIETIANTWKAQTF